MDIEEKWFHGRLICGEFITERIRQFLEPLLQIPRIDGLDVLVLGVDESIVLSLPRFSGSGCHG
jgi:hypothetical protein